MVATATAKKKVNVKAARKSGTVNRAGAGKTRTKASTAKPLSSSDVEAVVHRVIDERSMVTRVRETAVPVFSVVFEGLQNIANSVWSFCGKVYTTCRDALTAMYHWLGAQMHAAAGQSKTAYEQLRELVGSMSMESASTAVVSLMATAAALGIAIVTGGAVGVAMTGVATNLGASAAVAQVTSVVFASISAVCVAEVTYALSIAGLSDQLLAAAMIEAEAKDRAAKAKAIVVNAVKVAPVGA
jgi:hypothetical protein